MYDIFSRVIVRILLDRSPTTCFSDSESNTAIVNVHIKAVEMKGRFVADGKQYRP